MSDRRSLAVRPSDLNGRVYPLCDAGSELPVDGNQLASFNRQKQRKTHLLEFIELRDLHFSLRQNPTLLHDDRSVLAVQVADGQPPFSRDEVASRAVSPAPWIASCRR
jgi:hypothetical protein